MRLRMVRMGDEKRDTLVDVHGRGRVRAFRGTDLLVQLPEVWRHRQPQPGVLLETLHHLAPSSVLQVHAPDALLAEAPVTDLLHDVVEQRPVEVGATLLRKTQEGPRPRLQNLNRRAP